MRTFGASDYNIFSTAANTTNTRMQSLTEDYETIGKNMVELNSEGVFMGPICDSVMSGWETIRVPMSKSIQDLLKVILFVNETSKNYQWSDKTNADNIGSV